MPQHSFEQIDGNLLKNSALMIVSRLLGMLTLLLTVPAIIEFAGKEGYGVWESLTAISGIAMVLQTVISGTVLWRVSMSFGAQSPDEARRVVRIGIGATLILISLCVPLVTYFLDSIVAGLQISAEHSADAHWLLPLIVATMLLGGINESLSAVLVGYQKAGLASLIQSGGLIATNLASVTLLYLGAGLASMLIGFLVGFVAMFLALYPLACASCGRISLLPLLPQRVDLLQLGPFVALLFLSNITLIFREHTDKIVLAAIGSTSAVASYGIAQRLSSLVMQVCTVICVPFAAAIGAKHAQNDVHGIRELYISTNTRVCLFSGLMGVLLCTLHRPILILWLGRDYPEVFPMLAILLFGVTCAVTCTAAGVAVAKGIGRPGLETTYAALTLATTLALKPILITTLGSNGTVAASAAGWSIGAVLFLFLIHRAINVPLAQAWNTLGILTIAITVAGTGSLLEAHFAIPSTRFQSIAYIIAGAPILIASYFCALIITRLIPASIVTSLYRVIAAELQRRFRRATAIPVPLLAPDSAQLPPAA